MTFDPNFNAQVIAYVSVEMSPKEWSKNTFGFARAEVSHTKSILSWFPSYGIVWVSMVYLGMVLTYGAKLQTQINPTPTNHQRANHLPLRLIRGLNMGDGLI